ncbi:uncharacterized protein EV420DRAFT_716603 [Desarmillaria tabescens]|uniref:Uncharacterized protein n=1 Tax=Armillaria tabescens TaxID=1929756 RepID=A0AA39K125_ARMTA|nr:uncharacterized protein EV420DRAFT_716603 [Desarmillaria tabescens]KAK0451421.1 hypothetical protein EV420DRAFT_716603 [Desarmillaria tabescens]
MLATTKIVFPPPPPTTNCLSSLERSRLLRKTKKLERVLGSAPHFIDDPLALDLPFNTDSESIPSRPSTSSRSSMDSSRSLYRVTSIDRPRSRSMPSRRLSVEEPWPSSKPPLMKLSKSPGALPCIPASPLAAHSFSPSAMTPPDSPTAPEFIIPTNNSLRRQKMDRLRRKLGDGVPVDLVFPKQRESVVVQAQVTVEKFTPVLFSPPPVPAKPLQSRDSISYPSPHRAVRKVKRKPVPPLDPSELDALNPLPSPVEIRRRTLSLSSSSSECNSPASEYSERSFLWDIPEESSRRSRSFWTSAKQDMGREEDSEWLEVTYSKELGLTVSSPP